MSYDNITKIPILEFAGNAGSYKNIPIDLSDPRAADPLVKLSDFGVAGESFYARTDGGNFPYNVKIEGAAEFVWARKKIAEKLTSVNTYLRTFGVVLYVWDAYRPVTCQEGLWAFLSKQVATQFPHASAEEKINYTLKFLSDPTGFVRTDPTTWPVHSTGGAVDLTLRDLATGKLLDMGAGFDETEDISYSDAFERKLAAHEIAENYPALVNRRLLHTAMTREGFVNYPLEFWHFDYGDQMYILHSHLLGLPQTPSAAWYGYMESPEAN